MTGQSPKIYRTVFLALCSAAICITNSMLEKTDLGVVRQ
jgi:hypothetical protein